MLEAIENIQDLRDEEIKERVALNSKAKNTKHYVAKEKNYDVGFVSLDINPDIEYLILYEIFVPRHLRKKGYGSRLLAEIEGLAANLGYKKVSVNPKPFEEDRTRAQLVEWYQKHGYSEMTTGTGELEKVVNEHYT